MKITTKNLVLMAFFIALGIILPITFHVFGTELAKVLSPMHIPVFIAGALLGPVAGLLVGALTPLLSSLLTGMPPVIPMLPIMLVELAIFGYLMGYLFKNKKVNIYLSLIITMLIGRIGSGVVVFVLVHGFNIGRLPKNPLIFVQGSIVSGIPGIILHLVLVPLLVKYLEKSNYLQSGNFS